MTDSDSPVRAIVAELVSHGAPDDPDWVRDLTQAAVNVLLTIHPVCRQITVGLDLPDGTPFRGVASVISEDGLKIGVGVIWNFGRADAFEAPPVN